MRTRKQFRNKTNSKTIPQTTTTKPPSSVQSITPNTILESFKSGIGFSAGMEMVRGLSNSVFGQTNPSHEREKKDDKCEFENREFKTCIQNKHDVIDCIDVIEKLKLCNEKYA